jgi:type I restriction enzyme S subunit
MKQRMIVDTEDHISEDAVLASAASLVAPGAVLIVVRSGILQRTIPVAINAVEVALNQDMKGMIPGAEIAGSYLGWWIVGHEEALLREWRKEGATVESLEHDLILNTRVDVPPMSTQRAIAAFLDRKTAEIDALVAKKERLLELLEEKRTGLITQAVTRGITPGVKMAEHPLMHLVAQLRPIMYGIVLPGPNVDDGVPIVKGGDVAPGRLRLDDLNMTTRETESGYVRSRLRGGDLVYAIRGSIGAVEIVPPELEGANLTQDAARVSPRAGVSGDWLLWALRARTVFSQLDSRATGATIRGINIRDLKRVRLPVPPAAEQRAIAEFLQGATSNMDRLESRVREAVALLREYRTALITATVTGCLEVPMP